jgi:hypothetical protein
MRAHLIATDCLKRPVQHMDAYRFEGFVLGRYRRSLPRPLRLSACSPLLRGLNRCLLDPNPREGDPTRNKNRTDGIHHDTIRLYPFLLQKDGKIQG